MKRLENDNNNWDSFITMKRWLENRNNGKTFVDYFEKCGYKKIAIYGAGDLGKLLYEEVKESNIEVAYFVDRNAEGLNNVEGIPVLTIQEICAKNDIDILVITPIGNYEEICKVLVTLCPEIRTVSIREAVYEF